MNNFSYSTLLHLSRRATPLLIIFCMSIFGAGNLTGQLITSVNWENTIGGKDEDELATMISTNDGGYLLAGSSNSFTSGDKSETGEAGGYDDLDYWVVKIDSNGIKLWDKTIEADDDDILTTVIQCADGGFLLGGESNSNAGYDKSAPEIVEHSFDYWIVKIDSTGQQIWDRTYGGNYQDHLVSVIEIADHGFLLAGWSNSLAGFDKSEDPMDYDGTFGRYDYWICRTDSAGTILWDNTIGGEDNETLTDAIICSDGNFIIAGDSPSNAGYDKSEDRQGGGFSATDFWLVKIDTLGNIIWENTIGGTAGYENVYSIKSLDDNLFVAIGYSSSDSGYDKTEENKGLGDYWIVGIDLDGHVLWDKVIGGTRRDVGVSAAITSERRIIVGGYSESDAGADKSEDHHGTYYPYDYWIVCLDSLRNKLWDKTYGCENQDYFREVFITADDDVIIAGDSQSDTCENKSEMAWGYDNDPDFWLIKMSSDLHVEIDESISTCFVDFYLLPWGDTVYSGGIYSVILSDFYPDTLWQFTLIQTQINDSIGYDGYQAFSEEYDADSYLWFDCNTGEIVLDGYQNFWPYYEGDFAVILTKGECIDTSDCMHLMPIGIEDYQNKISLSIIPNPAQNLISIASDMVFDKIEIISISGRVLYSEDELRAYNNSIDISMIPGGFYLLKATHQGLTAFSSFIKM